MHHEQSSPLSRLTTPEDLDAALVRSWHHPVVIFKHSARCGISAQALDEVRTFVEAEPDAPDVCLVDVLSHRQVSKAVAHRLNVRHESPQILLVHEGRLPWHASHFRVTASALRTALQHERSA